MTLFVVCSRLSLYTLACLGAGDLCLRWAVRQQVSALSRWSMALLLGQAVLAPVWVGLLLAHAFSPLAVGGVLAGCAVAALPALAGGLAPVAQQVRRIVQALRSEPWLWRALAGVTAVLVLAGATALARYGSLTWDSRGVYFVESKLFAATHQFVAVPAHEAWLTVTLFGELHAAALMAIGGSDAARLFDWISMAAAALLLADLAGGAAGDRRASWLTAAMVFSTPVIVGALGAGNVYLYGAALGSAAVYAVVCRRPFVAGILAGSAILVKVSNAVVFAPAMAWLVVWQAWAQEDRSADRSTRAVVRSSALVAAGVALALLPHIVRSVVLFGDPIAMLHDPLLGGIRDGYSDTSGGAWRTLATYPVALVLSTVRGTGFTPLLAAFLPVVVWYGLRGRGVADGGIRRIFIAGLVGLAAFAVYVPPGLVPRFIVPAVVLLYPLTAASAAAASRAGRSRLLAGAIPAAGLVAGLLVTLYFATDVIAPIRTAAYLTGRMSEADREGDGGAYSEPAAALNRMAPAGSRMLALTYFRYWFRPDLIQCSNGRIDGPAIDTSVEPADFRMSWMSLAARGFDYLYVDRRYYAAAERALDVSHLPYGVRATKIFDRDAQVIYRLEFGADFPKGVRCRRLAPDAWIVADGPR